MSTENAGKSSAGAKRAAIPKKQSPTTGRATLDRATIVDAALTLVDEEGLEALTMRKLGRTLGVEAMSLYHHVADKGALIDAMIEQVYAGVELGELPERWQDRLDVFAGALRRALMAHPHLLPAVATRPVMSSSTMGLVEVSLAEITAVGLEPEEAQRVLAVIVSFIMGHVLSEAGARPLLGGHAPEAIEGFRSELETDEFPLVAASLLAQPTDRDAEFDLGIRFLIEGIQAMID